MKIALPVYDKRIYNGKKRKIAKYIDESCFTHKFILSYSYLCYWQRPDGKIYLKFCKSLPYSETNRRELRLNEFNQYMHKFVNFERVYVIG